MVSKIFRFGFMAAGVLFMVSCGSDSPLDDVDSITVGASEVSGCGGFSKAERSTGGTVPLSPDPETYCDAERILWQYEKSSRTLRLLNARVLLNCCGDHDITAEMVDGSLVVTENDQPENGTGRCRCLCVFDYYVDVSGVGPGSVSMQLFLRVDDTVERKWEGDIDLAAGQGEIVVKSEKLTMWCP